MRGYGISEGITQTCIPQGRRCVDASVQAQHSGRQPQREHLARRLLRDLPTEKTAWREVDRLGLLVRINSEESGTRIRFGTLAEYYLKADFGDDAVRPKSVNTIPIVEHYVRDYLIARWGNQLASDIRPLEIQRWLKSLHTPTDWLGRRSRRSAASCTGSTKSASCMSASTRIPWRMSRRGPSPYTGQLSSRRSKLSPF